MSAIGSPGIDISNAAKGPAVQARYLYGPVSDFLLLGGGSLIALFLLRLYFGDTDGGRGASLASTLALAHIINHPHFAHSYQIFYGSYREKLFSSKYTGDLRLRYFLVGIVAPIIIAAFLTWTVLASQPRILGLAVNGMFFLVGWHYVKQGYGMAMVDAALKRAFFSNAEKRLLLSNAYSVWIFSWLLINYLLADSESTYWGITYFVVAVPLAVLCLAGAACVVTTVLLASVLWKRKARGQTFAWNGLVAYGTSLYAWLLIRDPIVLLWVPLFHSLQYLAVVWRFQRNRITQTPTLHISSGMRMVLFVASGMLLGYLGFWILPGWLSSNVPYDEQTFGSSLYFFQFWIFINIHHYLLDTVMWRKGNPDVAEYLFNSAAGANQRKT